MTEENPEWPDKAMFGAILLLLAGTFGLLWSAVSSSVNFGQAVPAFLTIEPAWLVALLSGIALLSGLASLVSQTTLYAGPGMVAAVASLGCLGFESVLGLAAIGAFVAAHREGEPTNRGHLKIKSGAWPDKALAASLLLFVAGLVALFQAIALATDHFAGVWVALTPWGEAALDAVVAGLCMAASREAFHLHMPALGFTAAGAAVLIFGFYVLTPLLGAAALLLLVLAMREHEFHHGTRTPARAVRAARHPARKGT
ncbi:MAG: hypothetical protein ACYDBQ_02805 [Thermoplasmatota archaeon]